MFLQYVQKALWAGKTATPASAMPPFIGTLVTPIENSLCSGGTWQEIGTLSAQVLLCHLTRYQSTKTNLARSKIKEDFNSLVDLPVEQIVILATKSQRNCSYLVSKNTTSQRTLQSHGTFLTLFALSNHKTRVMANDKALKDML